MIFLQIDFRRGLEKKKKEENEERRIIWWWIWWWWWGWRWLWWGQPTQREPYVIQVARRQGSNWSSLYYGRPTARSNDLSSRVYRCPAELTDRGRDFILIFTATVLRQSQLCRWTSCIALSKHIRLRFFCVWGRQPGRQQTTTTTTKTTATTTKNTTATRLH